MKDLVPNMLEYLSMLFLGVVVCLVLLHLMNGTLVSWYESKFKMVTDPLVGTGQVSKKFTDLGSTK